MGTAGWISIGLGGWLLAGFWVAVAFGVAARGELITPRHEPEVWQFLRGRLQRPQPQPDFELHAHAETSFGVSMSQGWGAMASGYRLRAEFVRHEQAALTPQESAAGPAMNEVT
jgi:hypothetical protein